MIRVLQVIGKMGCGGAEKILMCLYENVDREKVQFDFVVHTDDAEFYDEEIIALGGRIFHAPKYNGTNIIVYTKWWRDFFEKHNDFCAVHGHIGSSAAIYLREAKRKGIYTIAHSHATTDRISGIKGVFWQLSSYPTRFVADYYMACSLEAGIDRFGHKVVASDRFAVTKNGIDESQFIFSVEKRKQIRSELHIADNEILIGHTGRFSHQKNHEFIINVFAEIIQSGYNAKLLLLGEGVLKEQMKIKCEQLGISDLVIFAGIKKNTQDYYAAMDVFFFPSFFEGLGIVAVEAQATGLKVVASTAVPNEADIGANLFVRLNLESSYEEWVTELIDNRDLERKSQSDRLITSGYSIKKVASELQDFYMSIEDRV